MSQVPITVKIDTHLKRQVQHLAEQLGLSLSAIVENKLREVVRDRRVVFEAMTPGKKIAKELEDIKADIRAGRDLSHVFANIEELEQYLKNL